MADIREINRLNDQRIQAQTYRVGYSEPDLSFNYTVVKANQPGPFLGVVAGQHGDENTGIQTADGIGDMVLSRLIAGECVFIPVANPDSSAVWKHGVTYVKDGEPADLNRAYSVSVPPPGSLIHNHAAQILQVLRKHNNSSDSGLVIDIHTEGNSCSSGDSLPWVRLDETADDQLLFQMMYWAEITGVPWVIEYASGEYQKQGLSGSLTAVLGQLKIPALTWELGPGYRIAQNYVNTGVVMAYRLLHHLGMVNVVNSKDPRPATANMNDGFNNLKVINSKPIKRIGQPLRLIDTQLLNANGQPPDLAKLSMLFMTVKPGEFIDQKKPVGYLRDPGDLCNQTKRPVFSFKDCYILSFPGRIRCVSVLDGKAPTIQAAVLETDDRIIDIYQQVRSKLDSERQFNR